MTFFQHLTAMLEYLLGRSYVAFYFTIPLAMALVYLVLLVLRGDNIK